MAFEWRKELKGEQNLFDLEFVFYFLSERERDFRFEESLKIMAGENMYEKLYFLMN